MSRTGWCFLGLGGLAVMLLLSLDTLLVEAPLSGPPDRGTLGPGVGNEVEDVVEAAGEASASQATRSLPEEVAPETSRFSGRVIDAALEPVQGAVVLLLPSGPTLDALGVDRDTSAARSNHAVRTLTGADGRFDLEALHLPDPGGDRWPLVPQLVVRHPAYVTLGHPCRGYVEGAYDAGEIRLFRGATLTGTILNGNGQPVRGATAKLSMLHHDRPEAWRPGPLVYVPGHQRDAVDAVGAFELTGLWPGLCDLYVQAEGYVPRWMRDLVIHQGAGLDLGAVVLSRGLMIHGQVLALGGGALEGVRVYALPASAVPVHPRDSDTIHFELEQAQENPLLRETYSNEEGRFHVSGLEEGRYFLFASLPDFEPVRVRDVAVGEDRVTIRMEREAVILLSFMDALTGQRILATQDMSWKAWRQVQRPAPEDPSRLVTATRRLRVVSGMAAFRMGLRATVVAIVGAGPLGGWIDVHAPGFVLDRYRWSGVRSGQRLVPPNTVDGSSRGLGWERLDLQREAILTGRVVDADGSPLSRATVEMVDTTKWDGSLSEPGMGAPPAGHPAPVAHRARTAQDGSFVLRSLPSGSWWMIARARGFAPSEPRRIEAVRGSRSAVGDVVVRKLGSIRGTVWASGPVPARGVRVTARRPRAPRRLRVLEAVTDTSGRFEFPTLSPGLYDLKAEPRGEHAALVVAGQCTEVVLRIQRRPWVSGRVLHFGQTVPWAEVLGFISGDVEAEPLRTRSSSRGFFRLELPLPGSYSVLARGARAVSAPLDLVLGWDDDLPRDLFLGESSLEGVVLDRVTGRGLEGVSVATAGVAGLACSSDARGSFRLEGLPRESCELVARLDGWVTARLGPLQLGDQHGVAVEIPMERCTTIVGRIEGRGGIAPAGTPRRRREGWLVAAVSGDGTRVLAWHHTRDGRFRFECLPAGEVDVVVVRPIWVRTLTDTRASSEWPMAFTTAMLRMARASQAVQLESGVEIDVVLHLKGP